MIIWPDPACASSTAFAIVATGAFSLPSFSFEPFLAT